MPPRFLMSPNSRPTKTSPRSGAAAGEEPIQSASSDVHFFVPLFASSAYNAPSYAPKYPHNTVLVESEAGHLIEIDDTDDAERIHIYHTKGSHIEMRPDGGVKYKTVKKRQDVTIGDHEILISGDWNIVVDGGYSLHVNKGELVIHAEDDAAINVKGKLKISPRATTITPVHILLDKVFGIFPIILRQGIKNETL